MLIGYIIRQRDGVVRRYCEILGQAAGGAFAQRATSAVRHCYCRVYEQALAYFDRCNTLTERNDLSRDVASGYARQVNWQARHAAPHEYVEVVQPDSLDAQQYFTGCGHRVGNIVEDELVAPTMFMYDDCAHVDPIAV